jgi:di/tripeptidase
VKEDTSRPWTPDVHSRLAKLFVDSFKAVTGAPKPVGFTQGSIETGEFAALRYDFEMVALAPSIPKAHCIGEFVDINECIVWKKVIFDVLTKLVD